MLEALETHDELNDSLWEDNKLKPEVREKLLQIVNYFITNLAEDDIDIDVKDILLVGSNAGYNYANDSDIDCHIIADVSKYGEYKDLAQKLYDAYRRLWNDKYDPVINGHEVEIFVEPYNGGQNE